jgi:UDP-hydrolysing UDP-N-acetyl-D-glucosamine 2-epimerase
MRRRIAILTGTRAEFGILSPVVHALQHSRTLRPHLLVTGMHLQKQFGHTVRDVEASGIPIAARIPMYREADAPGESLARATAGIARTLRELRAELLLLLGDRLEMLAGANAALATHTPIAHLHGGETAPGTWDEQIRHAVTKMAHLHFCATAAAAKRIRQMGEEPRCIHTVGAPALDGVKRFLSAQPDSAGIAARPILLVLHPSSTDDTLEDRRACMLLKALGHQSVTIIGPNNDPGHRGILRAYRRPGRAADVTMSLTQREFWRTLSEASVLIGNSSAGIIEAASFGVPVINVGDRQTGRERNANVLDVPWSAGAAGIRRAIDRALTDGAFRRTIARRVNLYGDGRAAKRIVSVLESQEFPIPTTKRFRDL